MKSIFKINFKDNGFTLVEIIATIIVMGILAAFFVQFMGTAQTKSWKSVELVAAEAEAEGKLEEIIAYFTSKINNEPDNALNAVKIRKTRKKKTEVCKTVFGLLTMRNTR